jgi:hypothetical protein
VTSLRFLYGVENNYANIILTFTLENEMNKIKFKFSRISFPAKAEERKICEKGQSAADKRGFSFIFVRPRNV